MFDLHGVTPLWVLRMICGFFFVPHIVGKFSAREASMNFFRAAGFRPPMPFVYAAMAIEVVLAVMLLAGLHVHVVGWMAFGYLLMAAVAVLKVSKRWLWHIGGCEFPLFWGICCAVLAALSP